MATYIVDKDGNQADASAVTKPADRHFRGAWSLSGSVISEGSADTIAKLKAAWDTSVLGDSPYA